MDTLHAQSNTHSHSETHKGTLSEDYGIWGATDRDKCTHRHIHTQQPSDLSRSEFSLWHLQTDRSDWSIRKGQKDSTLLISLTLSPSHGFDWLKYETFTKFNIYFTRLSDNRRNGLSYMNLYFCLVWLWVALTVKVRSTWQQDCSNWTNVSALWQAAVGCPKQHMCQGAVGPNKASEPLQCKYVQPPFYQSHGNSAYQVERRNVFGMFGFTPTLFFPPLDEGHVSCKTFGSWQKALENIAPSLMSVPRSFKHICFQGHCTPGCPCHWNGQRSKKQHSKQQCFTEKTSPFFLDNTWPLWDCSLCDLFLLLDYHRLTCRVFALQTTLVIYF